MQLTKACEAKMSCNQVAIDSATYVHAQDQFVFISNVAMSLYDIINCDSPQTWQSRSISAVPHTTHKYCRAVRFRAKCRVHAHIQMYVSLSFLWQLVETTHTVSKTHPHIHTEVCVFLYTEEFLVNPNLLEVKISKLLYTHSMH